MKILYVEDNAANVFLVRRVARMGKHEVLNYIDGDQVLNKFESIQPDLVLMDIQLSGAKSGLDVVRELRARDHTIPIIAVTAYAMLGDKERCLEAGCDDFMAKPLAIPQLIALFERFEAKAASDQSSSIQVIRVEDTILSNDDELPDSDD